MAKKKRKPEQKHKNNQTHSGKQDHQKPYEILIKNIFKEQIRSMRARRQEAPEVYDGLDYDSARQKRRIQAIIALLDEVKSRAGNVCPDIPGVLSMDDEWAEINAFPIPAYDYEERYVFAVTAAAIWILDRIREAGQMEQLLSFIGPPDDEDIYAVAPISDPCHSNDVLYSMVGAVYHRNDPDVLEHNQSGEIRRPFMSLELATDSVDPAWGNRSKFNEILSLIPEEDIRHAEEAFIERYWDFVVRYFRSRAVYVNQEVELLEDLKAFGKKVDRLKRSVEAPDVSKIIPFADSMNSVLSRNVPPLTGQTGFDPVLLRADTSFLDAARLSAESERLDERKEDLDSKLELLWHQCGMLSQKKSEYLIENFGEEIAEIWKDMDVGDPYEMCFAFLHLLDSGSDLLWCYFPGINLHTSYAARLPWPRNRYHFLADGIWNHFDKESGSIEFGPDDTVLPKRIRPPELEDWYRLQYQDASDPEDLYNLAQVMYEITGCIMPRKLDRYVPALAKLDRYGITGKRALHPLMYCMTLLGESRNQSQRYCDLDGFDSGDDCEVYESEGTSVQDYETELKALRAEVKSLKQQLYETGREVRDERERYEALAQKTADDAQELHDLRELVFNQQTEQHDEPERYVNIAFPYRTDRRIVVFGGHDSWAREMKPRFPDVRFIDREMQPNSDMIRRADVVWIQANALAHKHFYRIIDEVRKNGIPLRYFTYAGVNKCSEHLALEDMKAR